MNCPRCQHENTADSRFCESCGAAFESACASCGAALSVTARFCRHCGQPVETAAAPKRTSRPSPSAAAPGALEKTSGERRQLSVMFCDLVGSTELGQRLDPEDLREVLAAYQDACSAAVKRFEGYVAQYLGDGVLVYFGFPRAHEDDAQRAVLAGLAIQSSLADLNAHRAKTGTPEIFARIGIHTGLVVVSEMGAGAGQQPLALGDTVNIAARLEGVAEPGGVVISQATLRLVSGLFITRDLGTPELEGVSEPIGVFAIQSAAGVGGRSRSTGARTPLSGREEEIGQFRRRWEEVQERRGQVIAISGEPGIGKSRLIQAFREELAESPHTWLEVQCSPYTAGSAFQPIVELFETGLGLVVEDSPQEKLGKLEANFASLPTLDVAEVVPFLIPLLGLPPSPRFPLPPMGPDLQREKTFQALVAPLLAIVDQQPTLVVWEDLHWSDPSTVELLGRLIDQVPTMPMLLVLAFRPTFEPPWPLTRSYMCPVALSRLNQRHTREIVEHSAGSGKLPRRILDDVVARADGVPLFAEELARSVLDSGMVVESNGRFEIRGRVSDLTIPTTLQDSLMARLDRLSAAKHVAQLAATLGRGFSYELIESVADVDVPTLRGGLQQLVEAEILYQRAAPPESSYTFKHALIQDTAYESQLKSRRRELHAKIASVLEERFPGRVTAEPEIMARHCAEGGLTAQAITHYQHAGEQAIARLANAEAVEYFGRALELLASLPESAERHQQEVGLRLALAGPQTSIGGYDDREAMVNIQRVDELCDAVGEGPQQLAGLVGLMLYDTTRGNLPRASTYGERVLEIVEPLGIPELCLAGHMVVGAAAITASPISKACEHFVKALEFAERAELPPPVTTYDVEVLTVARSTHAIALVLDGRPDLAVQEREAALRRARDFGHLNTLGTALLNGAIASYFLDDPERSRGLVIECLALVRGLDFHTYESSSRVFLGWAGVSLGDADGIRDVEEGIERAEASGSMGGLVQLYFTAADAFLVAREFDRVEEFVERAAAAIERTKERAAFEPELLMFRTEILLESGAGTPEELEGLLHELAAGWRAFESPWMGLRTAITWGRLAKQTGKTEAARAYLQQLCDGFSEGFETRRLRCAREMLDAL